MTRSFALALLFTAATSVSLLACGAKQQSEAEDAVTFVHEDGSDATKEAEKAEVVLYDCENNPAASAVYPNDSTAIVVYNDEQHDLQIETSADGAKYANDDVIWWVKGDDATLFDAQSDETLDDCTVRP